MIRKVHLNYTVLLVLINVVRLY